LNFLDHIRPWTISRQLWWGHRIPVWQCDACGERAASTTPPQRCPRCGGQTLAQDPDVLDTWFSSGLWPFATLGWPADTTDLRYFSTKIWNAARFVLMNLGEFDPRAPAPAPAVLSAADRWIRSRYARLVEDVTAHLEAYEFDRTARALYDFIWSEYCDWYLEMAKVDLQAGTPTPASPARGGARERGNAGTRQERRNAVQHTLWYVLSNTMKLLH